MWRWNTWPYPTHRWGALRLNGGIMFDFVNWPATLLATVAATFVSAVCYLPPILGQRWGSLIKHWTRQSDADLSSNIPRRLGLWLLSYLVNAIFLTALLFAAKVGTVAGGIGIAIVAWIAMGLTFSAWPVIHANQPVGVWVMNNAVYLLAQMVMAAILVALK